MTKTVLVTNNPAPYREKVHELVSDYYGGHYTVIYCAEREAIRNWAIHYGKYKKIILSFYHKGIVHNNIKVFKYLNDIKPDVVIIMGFFPTMLYTYIWSLIYNKKLIVFTDGTLRSESHLSIFHRLVRKIVFKKTEAYIGPSIGAEELSKSYGIEKLRFFRSCLCVDNSSFYNEPFSKRKYDLMFSGQFIDRKMPFFFLDVAKKLKEQFGSCKILLLGSGPLKEKMFDALKNFDLDYDYQGFVSQDELPKYYPQAKVFLFPTLNDPWGVVANEAMASGTPIITCKEAGVSNDLVLDNKTGFILPLISQVWVEKIIYIIKNIAEYESISNNGLKHVQAYNFESASKGIISAIEFVTGVPISKIS